MVVERIGVRVSFKNRGAELIYEDGDLSQTYHGGWAKPYCDAPDEDDMVELGKYIKARATVWLYGYWLCS